MNIYLKKLFFFTAALIGMLFSNLVYAHPGHEVSVSFLSGLMHPLSGFDHLIVIVLVGFWSAFTLRSIWLGPCIFMLGMALGALSGLIFAPIEWFEFGIAASVIAIGGLLLIQNQYSSRFILGLIGAFGVFHGFAHAQLFASAPYGVALVAQDMAGLILATAIMHLSGALAVHFLKEKTSIIAKIAGFSSVIYGWVLISQLSFAVLGGA